MSSFIPRTKKPENLRQLIEKEMTGKINYSQRSLGQSPFMVDRPVPHIELSLPNSNQYISLDHYGEDYLVVTFFSSLCSMCNTGKRVESLMALKLPSARPFYADILCDEKDRIYLVRIKSILDKGPSVTMDILSKNGDFLYRAQSPFAPKLIRFGKIYVIEYGETGEGRIRRLDIRGYSDWKY
jgi:hypothetical protein